MEINRFGENVIGVQTCEAIVEGRFVALIANINAAYDFGSRTDLPGCRRPFTGNEAIGAHWCLMWAQDNRDMPIYNTYPAYGFALRQGFDQATNVPFAATVFVTQRSVQEGLTIPSGEVSIVFGPDSYLTVASGAFVWSAALAIPGCPLEVLNVTDDGNALAGMLSAQAVMTIQTVAQVVEFNTATWRMTFRILD
jgi:hypothetical protein